MNCPSCRQKKFCDSCGTSLALWCSSCQEQLRQGARFCDACGTPVPTVDDVSLPVAGLPTAPTAPASDQPTSFANGRYQVKRFLGEGGKKKVYLAHDTLLDREVAFALIKTEGLDDTSGTVSTRRHGTVWTNLVARFLCPHIGTFGSQVGDCIILSSRSHHSSNRPTETT